MNDAEIIDQIQKIKITINTDRKSPTQLNTAMIQMLDLLNQIDTNPSLSTAAKKELREGMTAIKNGMEQVEAQDKEMEALQKNFEDLTNNIPDRINLDDEKLRTVTGSEETSRETERLKESTIRKKVEEQERLAASVSGRSAPTPQKGTGGLTQTDKKKPKPEKQFLPGIKPERKQLDMKDWEDLVRMLIRMLFDIVTHPKVATAIMAPLNKVHFRSKAASDMRSARRHDKKAQDYRIKATKPGLTTEQKQEYIKKAVKHEEKADEARDSAKENICWSKTKHLYMRNLHLKDPTKASEKEDKIIDSGDQKKIQKYGLDKDNPTLPKGRMPVFTSGSRWKGVFKKGPKALAPTFQEYAHTCGLGELAPPVSQKGMALVAGQMEGSLERTGDQLSQESSNGTSTFNTEPNPTMTTMYNNARVERPMTLPQPLGLDEQKQMEVFNSAKIDFAQVCCQSGRTEGAPQWRKDTTETLSSKTTHFVMDVKDDKTGQLTGDKVKITLTEGQTPSMTFVPDPTKPDNLTERTERGFDQALEDFSRVNQKVYQDAGKTEPTVVTGMNFDNRRVLEERGKDGITSGIQANFNEGAHRQALLGLQERVDKYNQRSDNDTAKPQDIIDAEKILEKASSPKANLSSEQKNNLGIKAVALKESMDRKQPEVGQRPRANATVGT